MSQLRPVLGMALLAAALSLASCGTTPTAKVPDTSTTGTKLATLKIGPGVTRTQLQQAVPQASIISFDAQAGSAILAMPDPNGTLRTSSLGGLSALDASVAALEPDYPVDILATTEAMGSQTWAGGSQAWAGGSQTWAGGLNFLDADTQSKVHSYWNIMNREAAATRVPEGGSGIKVAVIDTGVDINHPLLKNNLDLADSYDFVDNDANPSEVSSNSSSSKYGHGTAVVGVILQFAPNAQIMVMRALQPTGNGPTSTIVKAVDKAVANGAKVINLSLGSNSNSAALNTSIANALAKGVLVVASAGNENKDGMLYPARNTKSAQFPASSGLIAVGSVDSNLKKSVFSNYGTNMTLTAPGENIVTSFPDNRLVKASGTSFSAPAVTGAIALAMSSGTKSVNSLATSLTYGATANADATYNAKLGAGTLNVDKFTSVFR